MPNSSFATRPVNHLDGTVEYWFISTELPGKVLCYRDGPSDWTSREREWVEQKALLDQAVASRNLTHARFASWTQFEDTQYDDTFRYFMGERTDSGLADQVRRFLGEVGLG